MNAQYELLPDDPDGTPICHMCWQRMVYSHPYEALGHKWVLWVCPVHQDVSEPRLADDDDNLPIAIPA